MADADKNIRITTNKNKPAGNNPRIVFTGSAAGSSVITLEVLDDNSVTFSSNEGQVFSLDSNLTVGNIWSVNDVSGNPILSASAGATIGMANYGGLVGIGTLTPQYKLHVQGGSVGIATTDATVQFLFDNGAASGSNHLSIRNANDIRFFNAASTFYTAIQAANNAANYTLTLPIAVPGAGVSIPLVDTTGAMTFAPITGVGISVIGSATGFTISHQDPHIMYFCAGYTPVASGIDSVVLMAPFSSVDGTSSVTYNIRRLHWRVETQAAGTSTLAVQKFAWNNGAGITTFNVGATGSTANILASALNLSGASVGETWVTSASIGFSTGGATCVSGDKFRLNFTAVNASHQNFSVFMILDANS